MNLLFYGLAAVAIMAVRRYSLPAFNAPETRSGTHTLEIGPPRAGSCAM